MRKSPSGFQNLYAVFECYRVLEQSNNRRIVGKEYKCGGEKAGYTKPYKLTAIFSIVSESQLLPNVANRRSQKEIENVQKINIMPHYSFVGIEKRRDKEHTEKYSLEFYFPKTTDFFSVFEIFKNTENKGREKEYLQMLRSAFVYCRNSRHYYIVSAPFVCEVKQRPHK